MPKLQGCVHGIVMKFLRTSMHVARVGLSELQKPAQAQKTIRKTLNYVFGSVNVSLNRSFSVIFGFFRLSNGEILALEGGSELDFFEPALAACSVGDGVGNSRSEFWWKNFHVSVSFHPFSFSTHPVPWLYNTSPTPRELNFRAEQSYS